MCNRYASDLSKAGREREWFGFETFSETPEGFELFPDRVGPVVVHDNGRPTWRAMRWGFPPPPKGGRPVTNVRNLESPFWRAWLKPEYRCLVPFTRFAEWTDARPKREMWFALPGEPLAFFAGIWRPWSGVRGPKSAPIEGEHLLFAFLTCPPNGVVNPIHAKAMPVILPTPGAQDAWLSAPASAVPTFAEPLPDDELVQIAA